MYIPNTKSIYNADIASDQTFVWLLLPSEGKTPAVKSRIISESSEDVKVEVAVGGKVWKMVVPFGDRERAGLE